MQERVLVTKEGLEQLKAEYDELVNVRRPDTIRAVAAAREEGDLRENAGYHAARHDLSLIEGRIKDLEKMLKNTELINEDQTTTASGAARIGSTVTIDIDGDKETYTIVGAVEASPSDGRISNESPFGRALLGHHEGETVSIQTPAAVLRARILSVE
jgi:transcription elongation factor GreA